MEGYKTVHNVFDCETLEILFETEDITEATKRLMIEKVKSRDVIRGVKFELLDYVLNSK